MNLNLPSENYCLTISLKYYIVHKMYKEKQQAEFTIKKIMPFTSNHELFIIKNELSKRRQYCRDKCDMDALAFSLMKFEICQKSDHLVVNYKFMKQKPIHTFLRGRITQQIDQQTLMFYIRNLFDLCIGNLGIDQLIMSYNNVLLQKMGQKLCLNEISMVGFKMIYFRKQLTSDQFKEIFCYLDSHFFKRKPKERINNLTKQRGFAILLLSLIMQQQITLIRRNCLEAMVDEQKAKVMVAELKELWNKFLSSKRVKSKIQHYEQLLNINLTEFFQKILKQQTQLNWIDIKKMIITPTAKPNEEKLYTQRQRQQLKKKYLYFAQQQWEQVDQQRFINAKIAVLDEQNKPTEQSLELIFALIMKIDLTQYAEHEDCADYILSKNLLCIETYQIWKKFTAFYVQKIIRQPNHRKEVQHKEFKNQNKKYYVEFGKINKKQRKNQNEENIQKDKDSTQQEQTQKYYQQHLEQKQIQQSKEEYINDFQTETEDYFNEYSELSKSLLKNIIKKNAMNEVNNQKTIILQHQRLQTLDMYKDLMSKFSFNT